MNWATVVPWSQMFCGLCWLFAAYRCQRGIINLWRGKAQKNDLIATSFLFVALTQVGFVFRWLLFSHSIPAMSDIELQLWTALYFVSGISALATVSTYRKLRELE